MTTKTSPLIVKVKKEIASDEIKDFAETAMNELLGWYGYGNVDRNDLTKCTTRNNSSSNSNNHLHNSTILSRDAEKASTKKISDRDIRDTSSTPENYNSSPDNSKSPILRQIIDKQDIDCGWCKRPVSLNTPEFLATPEGPRYCTESCFSQSRRASFKRAKTCDWCKHIRHAVSYVDFNDGASQLQFCSDKCLNQYKMQIFCKETQAHLDMNPHLKEQTTGVGGGGEGGQLITPDLWLKNCKSRSTSPASEESKSESPTLIKSPAPPVAQHKPLISVTPSSKLMSRPPPSASNPPLITTLRLTSSPRSIKSSRKRRSLRLCAGSSVVATPISKNNANRNNNYLKPTSTLTNSNNKIHDLSQPPSNVKSTEPNKSNHLLPPPPNLFPLRHNFMHQQQNRFMTSKQQQQPPHLTQHQEQIQNPQLPPHQPSTYSQSSQQLPHQPSHSSSATNGGSTDSLPQQPPPLSNPLFGASPPPVTILVPYPIVVPVPIPIPIPMPFLAFLKAAQLKLNEDKLKATAAEEPPNEPLDFTKTKETDPQSAKPTNPNHLKKDKREEPADEKIEHTIVISNSQNPIGNELENLENDSNGIGSIEQRLPKFKITRLNSKRATAAEPLISPSRQPQLTISKMNPAKETPTTVPTLSKASTSITTTPTTTVVTTTTSTAATIAAAAAAIITKESESSRPLRKRKRVVDCDYLR